jgi:hypothetical protein
LNDGLLASARESTPLENVMAAIFDFVFRPVTGDWVVWDEVVGTLCGDMA